MNADERFGPGDHLRVRRRNLYYHHGIYVGDGHVVEFGGASWKTKHRAKVRVASLRCFEQGSGRVELVDHSDSTASGIHLPDPLPKDEIVARAEWLAENTPQRLYSLVGSNCEHVANWCVTGWFESAQVRRFFLGWAIVTPLLAGTLFRAKRLPLWLAMPIGVAGFILPYRYNRDPFKWAQIIGSWPGIEGSR